MSTESFKQELDRQSRRNRIRHTTATTVGVLIVVVAAAIIVSTFLISVLQIRGNSMEPTVHEGDLLIANHSTAFDQGDVVAFYYNNKVLLKRVIAFPGDWVDIDDNGLVAVNGHVIREEYVKDLALGATDIVFPYQVPENRFFVLGDNRSVSIDSRSNVIGTITEEQVIGKVLYRVWPLDSFGIIR
ncbi:MAG TPA: signal peptidase I [Eggerthellaceae bacterium]|nr:signal peptidase I [Eggerthellaceae bacterium]